MLKIQTDLAAIVLDETVALVERWYNREERAWVIQLKNAAGFQVGESEYVSADNGGKAIAKHRAEELAAQYGVPSRKS